MHSLCGHFFNVVFKAFEGIASVLLFQISPKPRVGEGWCVDSVHVTETVSMIFCKHEQLEYLCLRTNIRTLAEKISKQFIFLRILHMEGAFHATI